MGSLVFTHKELGQLPVSWDPLTALAKGRTQGVPGPAHAVHVHRPGLLYPVSSPARQPHALCGSKMLRVSHHGHHTHSWLPGPLDAQTSPSLKLQAWGQRSGPGDMTADTCIRLVSAELWGRTTWLLKTVIISHHRQWLTQEKLAHTGPVLGTQIRVVGGLREGSSGRPPSAAKRPYLCQHTAPRSMKLELRVREPTEEILLDLK